MPSHPIILRAAGNRLRLRGNPSSIAACIFRKRFPSLLFMLRTSSPGGPTVDLVDDF